MEPIFYFDYNSPYAYLAAARIADVLPGARWRPIAFGILIREIGKTPWSFDTEGERQAGLDEIERRAQDRGLPPVRYPPGWPKDCYSLLPLRAAVVAERHGVLEPFSHEAFRRFFVQGRSLADLETVLEATRAAGIPDDAVRDGVADPEVKAVLTRYTDDAIALGVPGVPSVQVGDELFWGDDRLEHARRALSGR